MAEQVHLNEAELILTRINELMALHEFMADANIKSGSKEAETIMEIWVENKMPYTKQYPKGASMFDGFTDRAFYTKSRHYPTQPDTLNIVEGDIKDWIAEMSHAVQYNQPRAVRDSLTAESNRQKRIHGEERYGIEREDKMFYPSEELWGAWSPYVSEKNPDIPVEFEAHKLIEPLLMERYYKAVNKDLARENPIDAKAIELLKKYFLKDRK